MALKQTPSQTIGPFFAYGLTPKDYGRRGIVSNILTGDGTRGERITIEGRLIDGADDPVPDAMIEIWQANSEGRYAHPFDRRNEVALDSNFQGFGRTHTGDDGSFYFETIKPGRVPGTGNSLQAPHIGIIVFARGMLSHLYTRLYFSDEVIANEEDQLLSTIEAARRSTLVAVREDLNDAALYRLDIHLQGDQETVFLDV